MTKVLSICSVQGGLLHLRTISMNNERSLPTCKLKHPSLISVTAYRHASSHLILLL